MRLLLQNGVKAFSPAPDGGVTVSLERGVLSADLVLLSIGVRPDGRPLQDDPESPIEDSGYIYGLSAAGLPNGQIQRVISPLIAPRIARVSGHGA